MNKTLALSATFMVGMIAPLSAPIAANAQDVEVTVGADYVTEYVFRGVSLADEAIQPYAEATFGNFTAGVWASLSEGTGASAAGDEVDLYVSYSLPVETFSLDAGLTYYHYPQGGGLFETDGGSAGTYEVSLSAGFDAPLEPSITAYYDLTLEAFTLEGGLSKNVAMSDALSLDLGATAGIVEGSGSGYEYASLSSAVSTAIGEAASAYVGANLALSTEDSLDFADLLAGGGRKDQLWFGVGLSTGF